MDVVRLLRRTLLRSATKYISIPACLFFFFSICGMLHYRWFSNYPAERRGLREGCSHRHPGETRSHQGHICDPFSRLRVTSRPRDFLPRPSEAVVLLPPSLCKYLSPAFLRLATLPSTRSPLPSRARSGVLTLGFVQICSLWRWKVVMGAKKNSLAQTLTTMLVFLMKPNENSIFYPCYSLPSSSLPPPPPLSTSGASNLRKRFLIPTGDFSTLM